jgi:hypothetical protein
MRVKPVNLLTFNRLDVIFKILFLKYNDLNAKQLADDCYFHHIKIITNGLFIETNSTKNSYDKFLKEFKEVSYSIKNSGFKSEISKIPISKDNSINNGAHRLASCVYYNIPFVETVINNEKTHSYDYKFFISRGLSKSLVELSVLEFISRTDYNFLAIIWPSADKRIDYMNEFSNIVYEKKIKLNANGAKNFVAQVYKEHKWVGDFSNGYSGSYTKVSQAFSDFSDLHLIFFKESSLDEVVKIKNSLRTRFNIDKASIHITDNNYETYELAKLVLNENFIHFFNYSEPYKYKNLFDKLKYFRRELNSLNISPSEVIISNDSVLSLYGLKNTRSLYVKTYNSTIKKELNKHSKLINFSIADIELLYNPQYFFYFNEFKFECLQTILNDKTKTNISSSKKDLILINNILSRNNSAIISFKNNFLKSKYKLVAFLIPFTKKIGLYNLAKWFYKSLNL